MAKRRMSPEERAERERRAAETMRLLQERIDYHKAKRAEEEAARERAAQRRRRFFRLFRVG